MAADPQAIVDLLLDVQRLDRDWHRKVPETDRRRTPWMPFPVPAFVSLLTEALPAAQGPRFLEIGCGIGTKMRLAREIFGLHVTGVEVSQKMAAMAAHSGLDVAVADAADFGGYGAYDLIWFNRVFRDQALQAALEKKVWEEARPGAVVMCANLEYQPPGWIPVLDDWELRRGIWIRPLTGVRP